MNKKTSNTSKIKISISIILCIISLVLTINSVTCLFGHNVIDSIVQSGVSTEMFLWKEVLYPVSLLLLAATLIVLSIIIHKNTNRAVYVTIGVIVLLLSIVVVKAIISPNSCTSYGGFRCLNW
jgi:hypothetical protein